MGKVLLLQFLALALYVLFTSFAFCDGFKLHTGRKILWFIALLAISVYVLKNVGYFDLALILPIPSLLAVLLCSNELREAKAKKQ